MIKLVYFFRKKWGLTDEEFSRYWFHVHGPVGARIPGLRRLVQNHALASLENNLEFDGMAELWFDDLSALETAQHSSEWARLSADEANFIDLDATAVFIVNELDVPLPSQAIDSNPFLPS